MKYGTLVVAGAAALVVSIGEAQAPCASGTRCVGDSTQMARTVADDQSQLRKDADDSTLPWVLWSSQGEYYAAACTGAWSIPADRKLYVRNEETLKRLGFWRVTAQREDCTAEQVLEHGERLRKARR
jgi:hypothetical protein